MPWKELAFVHWKPCPGPSPAPCQGSFQVQSHCVDNYQKSSLPSRAQEREGEGNSLGPSYYPLRIHTKFFC